MIGLRMGHPTQLPPPKANYAEELSRDARAALVSVLSAAAIGSPQKARQQLFDFVERTKPNEIIVTAQIYDPHARLRSYELLVKAVSDQV